MALTPLDESRITTLNAHRGDHASLARSLSLSLTDFLAWFLQPHIQQALQILDDVNRICRENDFHQRSAAALDRLDELRAQARNDENPVEERRLISSTLHFLRLHRPARAVQPPPRHRPPTPPAPRPRNARQLEDYHDDRRHENCAGEDDVERQEVFDADEEIEENEELQDDDDGEDDQELDPSEELQDDEHFERFEDQEDADQHDEEGDQHHGAEEATRAPPQQLDYAVNPGSPAANSRPLIPGTQDSGPRLPRPRKLILNPRHSPAQAFLHALDFLRTSPYPEYSLQRLFTPLRSASRPGDFVSWLRKRTNGALLLPDYEISREKTTNDTASLTLTTRPEPRRRQRHRIEFHRSDCWRIHDIREIPAPRRYHPP